MPFSSISTDFKELSILEFGIGNNKLIRIRLSWKQLPKIRSYDVFGFRTTSNIIYTEPLAKIISDSSTTILTSNIKQINNGYGISIKLPTNCNSLEMQITFKTSSNGTIFASYQHSVKNISLNDSMNYSFSGQGLGGVFLFNNVSLFDKM